MNIDVQTRPEQDSGEDPARFNRRRLIRWVTILTVGILIVLAVWQEPLYAGRVG